MNRKQKLALVLGVVTIALMGLYPPWKESGKSSVPLEYAPIFSPPAPRSPENSLEVDLVRLLLQASVVAIVSAGLIRASAENPADGSAVNFQELGWLSGPITFGGNFTVEINLYLGSK